MILIVIINYNHSQVQMNCRRFAVWRFGTRAKKRKGQNASAMPRICPIGNYAVVIALTTGCKAPFSIVEDNYKRPPTPSMKAVGDRTSCPKPSQKKVHWRIRLLTHTIQIWSNGPKKRREEIWRRHENPQTPFPCWILLNIILSVSSNIKEFHYPSSVTVENIPQTQT